MHISCHGWSTDPLKTIRLFERLSIAIQQANAVCFTSTFKAEWELYPTTV